MKLPINRQAMAARNELDERDEQAQCASETPADRLCVALQLSDVARHLISCVRAYPTEEGTDLEHKAVLYTRPLRLLVR